MPRKLPVSPQNQNLPFHDPAFSWGDFEGFFTEFLRLGPVLDVTRDGRKFSGRIVSVRRYETSGDKQNGINIRAEVEVTALDEAVRIETACLIGAATPKFAQMVSRKLVKLPAAEVVRDLRENHARKVTVDFVQRLTGLVGALAAACPRH